MKTKYREITSYIGWEDYIAVGVIILGFIGYILPTTNSSIIISNFFIDIRSELIGIGFTVLIIDNVNEYYRREAERAFDITDG